MFAVQRFALLSVAAEAACAAGAWTTLHNIVTQTMNLCSAYRASSAEGAFAVEGAKEGPRLPATRPLSAYQVSLSFDWF
jgi:hypothetical protein